MNTNVIIQVDEDEYLLLNPVTRIADIVDGEIVRGLSRVDTLSEEAVSLLKRHGHLRNDPESELTAYEEYKRTHHELSAAAHYFLIPTYNCTMQCIYCYQGHVRTEKVISAEALQSFFDLTERNPPSGITLYGGEPLQEVTKPVVAQIIQFCETTDCTLSACTNGLDLDQFELEAFTSITVTLDGLAPVQNFRRPSSRDSFSTVVRNIEYTLEKGVPLVISINVDMQNITELPQFADFLIEKGWHENSRVTFELSHIIQPLDKNYPYLLEPVEAATKMVNLFKKHPQLEIFFPSFKEYPLLHIFFEEGRWRPRYWYCGASCSMHFFDPYGYIYPCYMMVGHEHSAIGRYHPRREQFSQEKIWRERSCFSLPQCTTCSFNYFCGGGCCYRQYVKTGSLTEPHCDMIKAAQVYVPFFYSLVKQRGELL